MSIVNVSEYSQVATTPNGSIQIPAGPPIASYDINVGVSSTPGPAFNVATKLVRLNTDVTCRVTMGVSPVAGASSPRFAASQTEYWGVPGPGMSIAAIQSS